VNKESYEKLLDKFSVILLGLVGFATAFATFQQSQYSGAQAELVSDATIEVIQAQSEYNAIISSVDSDIRTYNDIITAKKEIEISKKYNDEKNIEILNNRIELLKKNSASSKLVEKLNEEKYSDGSINPYEDDSDFVNSYIEEPYNNMKKGEAKLSVGGEYNTQSDVFGFSTVIFSVALFLLGIVSSFESVKIKSIITFGSLILTVFASAKMLKVPLYSEETLEKRLETVTSEFQKK